MELLFQEHGYEIYRDGNRLICVNRGTWALGYVAGLLGVAGFLFLALGLLIWVGAAQVTSPAAAPGFLVASVISLVASILLGRLGRRRTRIPMAEIPHQLTLDFGAGQLLDAQGPATVSLDTVRAVEHFDWATRGVTRVVVLRWTGGRRTVFRTVRRQRARDIVQLLAGSETQP